MRWVYVERPVLMFGRSDLRLRAARHRPPVFFLPLVDPDFVVLPAGPSRRIGSVPAADADLSGRCRCGFSAPAYVGGAAGEQRDLQQHPQHGW